MTLIRWSPSPFAAPRHLPTIQDDVNRLFDGFFTRGALRGDLQPVFAPLVDIEETPEEFIFRADLPGVAQKDVKVSLLGDTLTLRGSRNQESGTGDAKLHRVERAYGTFERTFTLGAPVRSDQVKAQYRDGVLEVRVPKAEEARMREVEIKLA